MGHAIRAAEHTAEAARFAVGEAQAEARAEATRLAAEWERAQAQILLYREGLLPQSQAALDAARASFTAGRGDFSTVIEDFQMWVEARAELASREADRFRTWAEAEALTSPALPMKEENP
jgi:outer membrane protein TolC